MIKRIIINSFITLKTFLLGTKVDIFDLGNSSRFQFFIPFLDLSFFNVADLITNMLTLFESDLSLRVCRVDRLRKKKGFSVVFTF
jgi:hypothetical protein